MLIKIIHKDQEKYKDIIMDSNYTYISCITLVTQDDKTGQISEDSERLNFEIQDNRNGQLKIEDRLAFYELYNYVSANFNDIDDIQVINEESNNIIFSIKLLGCQIERFNLRDRALTEEIIEYDRSNVSVCVQFILIKKPEEEMIDEPQSRE